MKTVLFLTQQYPYPTDSGGKIKTANTINTLAKAFRVEVVCFSHHHYSVAHQTINTAKFHILPHSKLHTPVKKRRTYFLPRMLSGQPFLSLQFYTLQANRYINRLVSRLNPDIIHVDHLSMAQYLPQNTIALTILESHNLESEISRLQFKFAPTLKKRLFFGWETILRIRFEASTYRKFHHIFAISDHHRLELKTRYHLSNVTSQPVVITPARPSAQPRSQHQLLFIGTLMWPPNLDAITWFLSDIYPLVKTKLSNTTCHIVGETSSELNLQLFSQEGVHHHGYLKSIAPFLNQSTALIMPFRIGSGIRIKALMAFAHRLPIISTLTGIAGLNLIRNQHYLCANSERSFATQTARLLSKPKLQRQLAQSAISFLKTHHSGKQNRLFLSRYQTLVSDFINT